MRAIQQKMVLDMLIALRDGKISVGELLDEHINPAQSTNTRLSIIGSKGDFQIPAGNLFSDYSDTYEFCLWLYHRNQQSPTFVDSDQRKILKLSSSELEEFDYRMDFLASLKDAELFHIS